jgi:hypothetical protein
MIATNHGLTGASIAIVLHNYPAIALPLAFASHFILDALPHSGFDDLGGHLKVPKNIFHGTLYLDATLLFVSFLVLVFNSAPWLAYTCWFLAGSPDIAWAFRYVVKEKLGKIKPAPIHGLNRFHSWIQWSQTRWGWLIEFPVMAFLFYFVSKNI